MFVNLKPSAMICRNNLGSRVKVATIAALLTVTGAGLGSTALADDLPAWKQKDGRIPVTVTLKDITHLDGPIYISIQNEKDFGSMKGFGGVIPKADIGDMQRTYKVDKSGEYAVYVWHDLDDDGRFSMTKAYKVLDGWGASGTPPTNRSPVFSDVKIKVGADGASVVVPMKYPN